LDIKRLVKKLLRVRGDERPADLLRIRLELERYWSSLKAHSECKQTFFRTGEVAVPDAKIAPGRCQVCALPLETESGRLQRITPSLGTALPKRHDLATWDEESSSDW
jgi:hypothetical protein